MNNIEIKNLLKSEINYLIEGFEIWYKKNNSKFDNNTLQLAHDIIDSIDTKVYKLISNNEIIGIFFLIETLDSIEIGGGLLRTNNQIKNTYYVFEYAKNYALKQNKLNIIIQVINKHYKYEAIIKYYIKYGFKIYTKDNNSTSLILKIK